MSQLGIGAMLGMLGGNKETVAAVKASLGKTIKETRLKDDDSLVLVFDDGLVLTLRDDGQSCCENRYMRTDDDLAEFAGAEVLDVELRDAPSTEGEYGECHDVQFLAVKTSKGEFVMSTHNEHNGYYGGFWIVASLTTE